MSEKELLRYPIIIVANRKKFDKIYQNQECIRQKCRQRIIFDKDFIRHKIKTGTALTSTV